MKRLHSTNSLVAVLRAARAAKGLPQSAVWERGERMPGLQNLFRWADVVDARLYADFDIA